MSSPDLTLIQNLLSVMLAFRLAAIVFFGIAVLIYAHALQKTRQEVQKATQNIGRILFLLGTAALIANVGLIFVSPVQSLAMATFIGVALVIAAITVFIERSRSTVALYFISSALVFLIMSIGSFWIAPTDARWGTHSVVVSFHVVSAVAGEGLFIVAFCASLLYLWFYRKLKQHQLNSPQGFPSLDRLDNLVSQTSTVGLILITASLISGLVLTFGQNIDAGFIKIVWAFLVWLWFVLAILGRSLFGWRGRRGAILTIWGAGFILFTLFGTIWTRF